MRRISIIAATAVLLVVTACGNDSGGDSDSGGELSEAQAAAAQAAAAQAAIDSAAESGITLDESCVNEVAAQLSDDDAALAAADPDAELSAAGEALGVELLSCADSDEIVDLFIESLSDSGESFDEACAREKIEDFGVSELIASSSADGPPAELITALTECLAD